MVSGYILDSHITTDSINFIIQVNEGRLERHDLLRMSFIVC